MEETKVLYHVNDEQTPYLIKLPIGPDRVTLADLKNALNRPNYKYFFKSMDDDFGVVKEEIKDDSTVLPCFNGRVVSWLVQSDGSLSDTRSQCAESVSSDKTSRDIIVDDRGKSSPVTRSKSIKGSDSLKDLETEAGHEKVDTPSDGINRRTAELRQEGGGGQLGSNSDVESTSVGGGDSDDDSVSKFSATTETTEQSSRYGRQRTRRRRHHMPAMTRASSISSVTDSSVSLNIMTVMLNMDRASFLGISVVGQSNKSGDGGIYVGSIMKGGAVALDGRIEPGDMILEVNGISFENMSNDDAVRTLREVVQKSGQVKLVVAKCWDPAPRGYFLPPKNQEPIRPIDPSAWIAHTEALRQQDMANNYGSLPYGMTPSGVGGYVSGVGYGAMTPAGYGMIPAFGGSSSINSSIVSSSLGGPQPEGGFDDVQLTIHTDMAVVARAMARPDSGLEIRDRQWLKITIPHAFIGSDLVNWLHGHVAGLGDRRDARKYAGAMLHAGLIKHTVNKMSFSEQCYYVLGDISVDSVTNMPGYGCHGDTGHNMQPVGMLAPNVKALSSLTLEDVDSVSEAGHRRDPHPRLPLSYSSWLTQFNTNPYGPTSYLPQGPNASDPVYAPPPPYNVVTGSKIVPPGCTSFGPCSRLKDPLSAHSASGSSASGSGRSQSNVGGTGGSGGGSGSGGSSCRKMPMTFICGGGDGFTDQCSVLGSSNRYSPNGRTFNASSLVTPTAMPQLLSTQLTYSVAGQGLNENSELIDGGNV